MKPTLLMTALLSASTAFAELPPLQANLGVFTQVFSSRGYDLVDTDDHLHSFRLAAGTTFQLRRWQLDVEGAFSAGGTETFAHQQVPSSLALTGLEVAGTARFLALSWLHPYVRVGVGYDWATLELFNETRLTQTVGNIAGHGGVGVQLAARLTRQESRAVHLLFDIGAGAVLRPAYAFTALGPAPVTGAQSDPIGGRSTVNLGTLPLSGITWRILVGLRF